MRNRLNRRQLFKGLAAAAAAASVQGDAPVRAAQNPDARFLIVIPGFGGAQLLRSVLPIRASEAGAVARKVARSASSMA